MFTAFVVLYGSATLATLGYCVYVAIFGNPFK